MWYTCAECGEEFYVPVNGFVFGIIQDGECLVICPECEWIWEGYDK